MGRTGAEDASDETFSSGWWPAAGASKTFFRQTAFEYAAGEERTHARAQVLRRLADEDIKKELEAALGVAAVKVSGGLEDEIQVAVDQNVLAQLDIPIETVVTLLRAENVNLSGGRLEEGTHQLLIRTLNQFRSVDEIGDVIVTTRGGTPIHLRDVATVRAGFKERKAITRIAGAEAVEVAIYKEGDANTVAVAREVEARVKRVNEILPKGVRIEKVYDQSVFIRQAVNEVISAGVFGGILAILVPRWRGHKQIDRRAVSGWVSAVGSRPASQRDVEGPDDRCRPSIGHHPAGTGS